MKLFLQYSTPHTEIRSVQQPELRVPNTGRTKQITIYRQAWTMSIIRFRAKCRFPTRTTVRNPCPSYGSSLTRISTSPIRVVKKQLRLGVAVMRIKDLKGDTQSNPLLSFTRVVNRKY